MTADINRPLPGPIGWRSPAKSVCSSLHWIILSPRQLSNPVQRFMPEVGHSAPGNSMGNKRLRSLLALVLLCCVAGVCISLGLWQLGRAEERDALRQAIEAGRSQEAVVLTALSPSEELVPWRAAVSQGRWSHEHTVLLQNRNLDGRPGYWLATPLLLPSPPPSPNRLDAVLAGSAEPTLLEGGEGDANAGYLSRGPVSQETAVLVLRGWLPHDMQAGGAAPVIPREEGMLEIRGELHSHVPRIFELWEWAGGATSQLPSSLPTSDGHIPQVQNLDLDAYARATGLALLPIVLAQASDSIALDAADKAAGNASTGQARASTEPIQQLTLRRDWPGPALDSDQNRGYALQWFSFSAIALIAALFVLRNLLRRPRPEQGSKEVQ